MLYKQGHRACCKPPENEKAIEKRRGTRSCLWRSNFCCCVCVRVLVLTFVLASARRFAFPSPSCREIVCSIFGKANTFCNDLAVKSCVQFSGINKISHTSKATAESDVLQTILTTLHFASRKDSAPSAWILTQLHYGL